jgi:uracil-DNA glycosylase family 4
VDSLFDAAEGGESREERLQELARQVAVCTRCDLSLSRTNTVFGSGDPHSPLILVGEGPGENEDATGLPFVGRAGKLLDDILAAVDLTRQQVYLTNIVKCRAAVEEGGRMKNRQPRTGEIRACNPYLQGQIEAIKPKIILCLGGPAAKTIIDKDFRITKDRGRWYDLEDQGDGDVPPCLRPPPARRRPPEHQAPGVEGHPERLCRVPESPRGAGNVVKIFIPYPGCACYHAGV